MVSDHGSRRREADSGCEAGEDVPDAQKVLSQDKEDVGEEECSVKNYDGFFYLSYLFAACTYFIKPKSSTSTH